MITLTFLLCAIVPFIIIFVIGKLIISLFEKGLDFVINAVFSLPEKVLRKKSLLRVRRRELRLKKLRLQKVRL